MEAAVRLRARCPPCTTVRNSSRSLDGRTTCYTVDLPSGDSKRQHSRPLRICNLGHMFQSISTSRDCVATDSHGGLTEPLRIISTMQEMSSSFFWASRILFNDQRSPRGSFSPATGVLSTNAISVFVLAATTEVC